VEDLNDAVKQTSPRFERLFVTKEAALALYALAKKEGATGQGLSVQVKDDGGFHMEFRASKEKDEREFFHEEVSDVKIWVSSFTLQKIGGSTITLRDGGFHLELL
jgi:Fe-S cluster assembly iron-binding protein IscA